MLQNTLLFHSGRPERGQSQKRYMSTKFFGNPITLPAGLKIMNSDYESRLQKSVRLLHSIVKQPSLCVILTANE